MTSLLCALVLLIIGGSAAPITDKKMGAMEQYVCNGLVCCNGIRCHQLTERPMSYIPPDYPIYYWEPANES